MYLWCWNDWTKHHTIYMHPYLQNMWFILAFYLYGGCFFVFHLFCLPLIFCWLYISFFQMLQEQHSSSKFNSFTVICHKITTTVASRCNAICVAEGMTRLREFYLMYEFWKSCQLITDCHIITDNMTIYSRS